MLRHLSSAVLFAVMMFGLAAVAGCSSGEKKEKSEVSCKCDPKAPGDCSCGKKKETTAACKCGDSCSCKHCSDKDSSTKCGCGK